MMQFENKRRVTLVGGVSGSGKTTFCLRYLVNAPVQVRFAFDPDGEIAERLRVTPARSGGQLDTAFIRGTVVFDPEGLFGDDTVAGFKFFCDWAYEVSRRVGGRKVFFVDEVWEHCSPNSIPDEFARIGLKGRKVGLELLVALQEPQRLNGRIRNGVSEVVAFHVADGPSLEFLAEKGLDPAEVQALPDFYFVARNCNSGGILRGKLRE
jgi:hypothetical protein